MEISTQNRWQVRLVILVIFVLGFIAGLLSMNFYHSSKMPSFSSREERYQQIISELDLTPEQRAKMEVIFKNVREEFIKAHTEHRPIYMEITKRADEQWQAVLTPEQWQHFQQMRAKEKDKYKRYKKDFAGHEQ
jgi:Spy/CpxP family protein refolding chaperone